jgi:hypothetical protein
VDLGGVGEETAIASDRWKMNVNPERCVEITFFHIKKSKYVKKYGSPPCIR